MNHETEEMLTALLDGQLTADQEKELRARLENEASLREIWEQLQSQRQLLRGLPRVKAPDDFLGKVAVALQEQAPCPPRPCGLSPIRCCGRVPRDRADGPPPPAAESPAPRPSARGPAAACRTPDAAA